MKRFINNIIKILISSDFFLNLGWGLVSPIFALFIAEKIAFNNIAQAAEVAGFAALSYWIAKSIFEIPIGHYLDKDHGEKDDFWFLIIGTLITALVPIGYLFASYPWHIYALQALHGIGMAMSFPPWLAIFTRHIDKGREGLEWGIESTFLGLGAGIAGGLGGIMVAKFGFEVVFISVGLLTLFSAILILIIKDEVSPRNKRVVRAPKLEQNIVEP